MKAILSPPIVRFSLFIFLILLSMPLAARGGSEKDQAYHEEIEALFDRIMTEMEMGGLTGGEGKMLLSQVRLEYGRNYTDFDGMLDALLDSVEEGKTGVQEARMLFHERMEMRKSSASGSYRDAKEGSRNTDSAGAGALSGSGDQGNGSGDNGKKGK